MKRWLGLLLLAWAGLLLQAQAFAELRAPFYKAARNGQVVYVLGTLHVGRAEFYPLRPAIEAAAKESLRVFMEIDQDDAGVEQKMNAAMLCRHPCLKQALSETEWDTLARRLGSQATALRALENMRPWAAAIVLMLGDFAAQGLNARHSVEKRIAHLAEGGGQTVGLESAEEQIRLFTDMTPAEQKEMLVQWLNMSTRERMNLNLQLVELWKSGDADAMHAWYKEIEARYGSPETAESFERKFLLERNRILVERLLAQVGSAGGPFFLAVGALHLGGPDGVLALLRQRGFKVEAE